MSSKNALVVEDVSFSYKKEKVLSHVSFQVNKGEILGIVGANGSGKTTLLKLISQFLPMQIGKIAMEDNTVPRFGGFIETPKFWNSMTGMDNARYYLRNRYDAEKIQQSFCLWNMDEALTWCVKKYSLGMKQKLAIIISMESNADILLFDEPTNTLDYESRKLFYKQISLLKQKGKIILVVSHDITELCMYASKMVCIKDGVAEPYFMRSLTEKRRFRMDFISKEAAAEALKEINNIEDIESSESQSCVADESSIWIFINPNRIPDVVKRTAVFGIMGVTCLEETQA